jgi:hypothetical protein
VSRPAESFKASLRATRGKIYGADGAAARLGLKPGTLGSSRSAMGNNAIRNFALARAKASDPS